MRVFGLLLASLLGCCPAFGQSSTPSITTPNTSSSDIGIHASDGGNGVTNRLSLAPPQFDGQINLAKLGGAPGDLATFPDNICYTMRTYVVARDSKTSDSVHPVSSSTCQPGKRYGLKTTEADYPQNR